MTPLRQFEQWREFEAAKAPLFWQPENTRALGEPVRDLARHTDLMYYATKRGQPAHVWNGRIRASPARFGDRIRRSDGVCGVAEFCEMRWRRQKHGHCPLCS